jgi:hypothetical protein
VNERLDQLSKQVNKMKGIPAVTAQLSKDTPQLRADVFPRRDGLPLQIP